MNAARSYQPAAPETPRAASTFAPGGPVAAMHEVLAERLAADRALPLPLLAAPYAPDRFETAIAGLSRAAGPFSLVAAVAALGWLAFG